MRAGGATIRQIRLLWLGVAVAFALATPLGYVLARATGGHFQAAINGFATGKGGRVAGLATTLGFAVAAGLSTATA